MMRRCRDWMACLVLAAAPLPALAQAQASGLFGVGFEAPFEYTVRRIEDQRRGPSAVSVAQWQHIEVTDPEGGPPRRLMLGVSYMAPPGVSNAVMQEAFDESTSESASRPDTRDSARVEIDGFPFHFIDGPLDEGDYPQRMSISGVVNGAMLRLSVLATDTALLTPELAQRLKQMRPDYAGLLRAKADFEAEARLAVQDDQVDTPLSRVTLARGVQARLVGSYLQTDGSGRPLFRSRSFSLFKAGFWTMQGLSLTVGCGGRAAFDEEGPGAFLTMAARMRDKDEDDRPTNLSPAQPSTLAGLPAQLVTAKGARISPMRRTDISRWQVERDDDVYQMEIERFNGAPVEKDLIRQLQDASPMCQLGLQFGARAPE